MMTTKIDLYNDKGSCQICSTSTVQRRVERAEFANHARRHRDAGDPVELIYSAGIRKASQSPDTFKIIVTTTQAKQIKNYYVLGQYGSLGELILCTDDGAAEVEFGHMHLSPCKRIARTRRPITEEQALAWFQGEMTAIQRRDSRFNIHENTFEELGRRMKRGRETLNAY